MSYNTTVHLFAEEYGVWALIEGEICRKTHASQAPTFIDRIGTIPVRSSHATRRLGSYSARGSHPVCIRLQFAQEEHLLLETFLHEVAHACHHLASVGTGRLRLGHGAEWKIWAKSFGVPVERTGKSEALTTLYRSRLKIVAVCRRCGATIMRQRRLDRRRTYIHPPCGGEIVAVVD